MENNNCSDKQKLKEGYLVKIRNAFYYVFKVIDANAFLYRVDRTSSRRRGIVLCGMLFIPRYADFRCEDVYAHYCIIIGKAMEFVPNPPNVKLYADFVMKTLPTLRFGDVIYAIRGNDVVPSKYHVAGHEEGPFLVLSVNGDKILCFYMTSSSKLRDTIQVNQNMREISLVDIKNVLEISFERFISKSSINLDSADIKKIKKIVALRGAKRAGSDDYVKVPECSDVKFEVGDLVCQNGSGEMIIVGERADDSYIAIRVTGMKAQTADSPLHINYYNPIIVSREDIRYINTLSDLLVKTVLIVYKEKIKNFYDASGNWTLPVGTLIRGPGGNSFYVFSIEGNTAHCFLVYNKTLGSEIMSIDGKDYYVVFNSLYDVNIASNDYVVKGLATQEERVRIAARMNKVNNQPLMTISGDNKNLVGKIIQFSDNPEDRRVIVAEQEDTYFLFPASDLLEGNYRNGYFIRKRISSSLQEPTAEEQEAINAYLGRQYSGEGLVFTLKNNVENE